MIAPDAFLSSCTSDDCSSYELSGVTCDSGSGYSSPNGFVEVSGCSPSSSGVTLSGCILSNYFVICEKVHFNFQ